MYARRPVNIASTSFRRLLSTEASGVKVVSKEDGRPVTQLSLILKGGSRYDTTPGVAHLLEKFAFKNTAARSALRLVRESELLGGQLSSSVGRENIVLTAKFLREDLPYFVEALSDVAKSTIYNEYEYVEDVVPLAAFESSQAAADNLYVAQEAAHEVAFRNGLGNPILSQPYNPITIDQVKTYAREVYTKANLSVHATGVEHNDLNELVGKFFKNLGSGSPLATPKTQFHSGESRIKALGPTTAVLAFPLNPSPANTVLSNLLGSGSSVKWSVGSSPLAAAAVKTNSSINSSVQSYSDADLLSIQIGGADVAAVNAGIQEAIAAVKSLSANVSEESVARAVAKAKFAEADREETDFLAALEEKTQDYATVNAESIKKASSDLLNGNKVLSVVGKTHEVPYLDQLF
jgi:ubiquinol-cytochrome c reductase core subunit 2